MGGRDILSESGLKTRLIRTLFLGLIVLCIGSFLAVHSFSAVWEDERTAAAPRVTAEALEAAYEQHPDLARHQYDNQWIVVTGQPSGIDGGLLGDGCLYMGSVVCDVEGHFGSVPFGKYVTIFGQCQKYNTNVGILLRNCRILNTSDR